MLINFYVFLALLFLCAGLAVDVGMVQVRRLALQHAADAAALGALYEKSRGYTDWVAAGKADAALNGFADGVSGVTITIQSPPSSGSYSGDDSAVQVLISQTYPTTFMGVLGSNGNATPGTGAVAKISKNPDCVYIMGSPSSYYSLINRSYSGFYPSCNIYVNSTIYTIDNESGSTISLGSSATIKVRGAAGTASIVGPTTPTPTYGVTAESDPLGYVTAPSFSSCTTTTVGSWTVSNVTTTLSAGTYCNGLNLSGATVTFNPGVYIVTGGMNWSNSTVTGSGVMFYVTSGGGYSYGTVNIANSTVHLSAPTSSSGGAIGGIVMFGDRNWSPAGSWSVLLNASYVSTDGIWYIPNVGISNYNSTLTGPNYLGLVTYALYTQAATFTFPSPNYTSVTGGDPFQGSTVGGLVE